jgi:hypothetical protein
MGDPVGCGYGSETEIVVSTLHTLWVEVLVTTLSNKSISGATGPISTIHILWSLFVMSI